MRGPTSETLKKILIVLCAAAAALGILAYLVVFLPSSNYQPAVIQGSGTTFSTLPTTTPNGANATGSGFIALPTSTSSSGASNATSTVTATEPGTYATSYAAPYPLTWRDENGVSYAVTAAAYTNGELTLTLFIQIGLGGSPCVPDTIRLVTDEMGDQESPSSPAGPNFTFPDTGTCNGTPGATYSESLVFPIAPTVPPAPYLLTTGGTSNTYFMAATSTNGGVVITLPATQG